MKNFTGFIGIIALVTIIGFSMSACETTGAKKTNITQGTLAMSGFITITGLDEYNGFYIYAAGLEGETYLIAADDVFDNMGEELKTGASITNGIALLPVWKISREFDEELYEAVIEKISYTEDINMNFSIIIWDGADTFNRFSEIQYNGDIYISTINKVSTGVFNQALSDDDGGR